MSKIKSIKEIEEENDRLSKIQADVWKREERYTHTVLEQEGFIVEPDTAKRIISSLAPEKLAIQCDKYYFMQDKYSACIVGVDNCNIGLFTLELPKEIATHVDEPWNLEGTLDFFTHQQELFKKVRIGGYLFLGAITVLIMLIIYVSFGFNRITSVMMAVLALGLILTVTLGVGG